MFTNKKKFRAKLRPVIEACTAHYNERLGTTFDALNTYAHDGFQCRSDSHAWFGFQMKYDS